VQIEYVKKRCSLLGGTTVGFALNECQYLNAHEKMVSSNKPLKNAALLSEC
jgi:hypothetical protein